MKIGIIGGGAAGFFAAVTIAGLNKLSEIIILEKSPNVLSKVKVSGGGRCNVTNSLLDVSDFARNYPRGQKELVSVFSRFGNSETIKWFKDNGVKLKTESDGRVFPVSDSSQTIIDLFLKLAEKHKIKITKGFEVSHIKLLDRNKFSVTSKNKNELFFDKLLISAGGFTALEKYSWIQNLGHTVVNPVPSLFTFNCKDAALRGLQGLSMQNAEVKINGTKLSSSGDILITHWGFSGPVILKLSSIGARLLNEMDYRFNLQIKWTDKNVFEETEKVKAAFPQKLLSNHPFKGFSHRLWEALILKSGILPGKRWSELSRKDTEKLTAVLTASVFSINGKSTFKEEFVTAGGVNLKEVDFRTMQSKVIPNLFFAGEILDIDGITGGFNFQSAWSTGYIAGCEMAK